MQPAHTIDLDAYFSRIGYTGSRGPSLDTLHSITHQQVSTIPFENLDVLLGRAIDVQSAPVEQKLVKDQRGGYCFEQNHLLLLVLRELGFAATPISARVRWQQPRNFIPPRTHLFIRVEIDGESWITDAGVGGLSLTAALRLNYEGEQSTPHEPRRVIRDGGSFFHQVKLGDEWADVCEFTGEEMPPIDRELANWWTSTHPQSKFRQNLMAAIVSPDGTRFTLNNREFSHRRGGEVLARREIATPDELLEILSNHFRLHFPEGTRFGLPDSPWPS